MSRAELTRTVEGPQRRMPRHIFSAFCLTLLLLGCAYAANDVPDDSVTLFAAFGRNIPSELGVEVSPESIDSFTQSLLVGGGGVMVALTEVRYRKDDKSKWNTGIAARYIETEGPDWANKAIKNDGNNWKTQLVLRGKEGDSVLRNPAAVIKGDKIYLLVLNNTRPNGSSQNGDEWHFEVAVGAIRGEVGSKNIEWGPSDSLQSKLTQEVEKKQLKVIPGSSHPIFLTSNGTILFSSSATNTEGAKGYAILQLKDDEEQWEVSFVKDPEECRRFSLFERKEKLISVFFGCLTDTRYVKEYDEVKEEWKDVDDALLHFWSSDHALSDLYSVTIENTTALLFIDEKRSGGVSNISLWYTESNRIKDSEWRIKTPYEFTPGGLLYINGELFVMYQDIDKGLRAFVLTHLNQETETIKSVLKDWAENDAYLSRPCNETAPEGAFPDTLCVSPMPTNGLVGFLSNNSDNTHWQDEYRFMNATVSGTKVENGYTFNGAGEGAWWPVGETILKKGYNFTRRGLTVVSTMSIHEAPKDNTSLLSVEGFGFNERVGLWYKDQQWKVVSTTGQEEHTTDFEIQKEYRVALILHNNTISMYVDGNSQGGPLRLSAPGEKSFDIKNIYIGGYGLGSGIHMTATNVLLYNRVLNDTELEAINKTMTTWNSTDPKDGSVCVRMTFTLLFLMIGFCLAIFW